MSKRWTQEEVSVLRNAVQQHGEGNWKDMLNDEKFNEHFSNRGVQSLQRKWQRLHRVKSDKTQKNHKPKVGSFLLLPNQSFYQLECDIFPCTS